MGPSSPTDFAAPTARLTPAHDQALLVALLDVVDGEPAFRAELLVAAVEHLLFGVAVRLAGPLVIGLGLRTLRTEGKDFQHVLRTSGWALPTAAAPWCADREPCQSAYWPLVALSDRALREPSPHPSRVR